MGEPVPVSDPSDPETFYVTFHYNPNWGYLNYTLFQYEGGFGGDLYDGQTDGSGSDSFSVPNFSVGNAYYFIVYNPWVYWNSSIFYPTLNQGVVTLDDYGNLSYSDAASLGLSLANGGSLNNLTFRYMNTGVQSDEACSVTNLQFVQCGTAFDMEGATLYAGNVLMSQVGTGFGGQYFQATVEHLTFDQGTYLGEDYASGNSRIALTNSLLTGMSDWSPYGSVAIYASPYTVQNLASGSGVYQPTGAGSYYLATNCPAGIRNSGTANINPGLRAQIRQKTTWPPVVYANTTISVAGPFSPQAPRDTNTAPDLGYHYDPLDYVFGGVQAATNLTFTAGTAVGWFDVTTSPGFGIIEDSGVTVQFNGTATAPCWLARYDMVQETGNSNWAHRRLGFRHYRQQPQCLLFLRLTAVGDEFYQVLIEELQRPDFPGLFRQLRRYSQKLRILSAQLGAITYNLILPTAFSSAPRRAQHVTTVAAQVYPCKIAPWKRAI